MSAGDEMAGAARDTGDADASAADVRERGGIEGERGRALVRRGATLRGRMQTALVLACLAVLAGGFAVSWYRGVLRDRTAATNATGANPRARGADGEYVLPPLGAGMTAWLAALPKLPLTGDAVAATATDGGKSGGGGGVTTGVVASSADAAKDGGRAAEGRRRLAVRNQVVEGSIPRERDRGDGALYIREPRGGASAQAATESRLLTAPVFWQRASVSGVGRERAAPAGSLAGSDASLIDADASGHGAGTGDGARVGTRAGAGGRDGGGELASALRATGTPSTVALALPEPSAWLARGSMIDCTLETAIDTTLPGLASCVTAFDVYGSDGARVLLPRGTKLTGEVRAVTRTTQRRVFVLWQDARTPQGVIVPLASPGTDALGRSGVPGRVDRHFLARFGSALLVSVIDAGAQRLANEARGDSLVINPRGSSSVATELLRDTIAIPPTIRIAAGMRVQVLVARNVDFRAVPAAVMVQ